MLEKISACLDEYLNSYKWNKFNSDKGHIYSKFKELKNFKEQDFLRENKRRGFIAIETLYEKMKLFFNNKYERIEPLHIVNQKEDTLFTSAGVQIFNSNIESEKLIKDIFIAQPVIRTQFIGYAKEKEGYSTSFVNVCTEKRNASEEDYIKHLDSWLSFFSSIGIFAGDLTLKSEIYKPNWKKGEFWEFILSIDYKGLRLGDAGYVVELPVGDGKTNVCDFGFGLERIAWAINKTQSYYDTIWPGNVLLGLDREKIDNIRTATLLASSNVTPSNKKEGYRLRKLLKNYSGFFEVDTSQLISDFYNQWNLFTNLKKSLGETINTIYKEICRNKNLNIISFLELSANNFNLEKDLSEFIKTLLVRGVTAEKLKMFIDGKRTSF